MKRSSRSAPVHDSAETPARSPDRPSTREEPAATPLAAAGNLQLQRLLSEGMLRARLEVGSSDDPAERDADRMAARMTSGGAACSCEAGGGSCGACGARASGQTIRLSPDAAHRGRSRSSSPGNLHLGGGHHLRAADRAYFGPRVAADLRPVRIHADGEGAAAAEQLGARAFAFGNDITFGRGHYRPQSGEGRRLLAHELAHVAQWQAGTGLPRIRRDNGVGTPAASASTGARIPAAGATPTEPREETPLRPSGEWFTFRGVSIAADREFMRGELRRLIGAKGIHDANSWYSMFIERGARPGGGAALPFSAYARSHGGLRPRTPLDVVRDAREDERRARVAPAAIPIVRGVYPEVRAEAEAFLGTFETKARDVTRQLLSDSKARIESERLRYGLERTEVVPADWSADDFGQPERPEPVYRHSMSRTLSSRGLVGAAQDLVAKRREAQQLSIRRDRLVRRTATPGGATWDIPPENQAAYDRLGEQIEAKNREYDLLRSVYEGRYPILASFASRENLTSFRDLSRIARGVSTDTAELLNADIYEKLANIEKVQSELGSGGRVKIWKLPEVVILAKQATGAMDPTSLGRMKNRVVDDKVKAVADEEFWTNLALAALAITLALLAAVPTGGSSLVAGVAALASLGSLGVSIYTASEHLAEYRLQSAMAGTDFEKARAISAEEPSLFWLAVDIIGAVADVGPALRGARTLLTSSRAAFRELAPAVRRALAASGPDAAVRLDELRHAASAAEARHGASGLASRVMGSVERMRGAGGSVERGLAHAAGHEATAVSRAARELERGTGRALARSPTRLGGHTVSVTPGGWLVRCSVCGTLREEFAFELARSPDLARRVFSAEDLARTASRTGNRELAQRAADEARAIADELEAVRRTRDIRVYRGVRTESIEDVFLMDRRLVVDMPFVGVGRSGTNAAGWLRDQGHYWEALARRHPEAFSPDNLRRIRGDPPLARPVAPVNDPTFRRVFPQYDVRGLRGQPLIHHHIGGGGQAAAIPAPLHPGFGGIHNVERGAGIWGGEDPVAEMLQRLLEKTRP